MKTQLYRVGDRVFHGDDPDTHGTVQQLNAQREDGPAECLVVFDDSAVAWVIERDLHPAA